jgi:Mn2+/Fe2+ NRAMP family transporter
MSLWIKVPLELLWIVLYIAGLASAIYHLVIGLKERVLFNSALEHKIWLWQRRFFVPMLFLAGASICRLIFLSDLGRRLNEGLGALVFLVLAWMSVSRKRRSVDNGRLILPRFH